MSRKGENIYKRKDGRWEGRYIKGRDMLGKARYGFCYAKTYREAKEKVAKCKAAIADGLHSDSANANRRFGIYCDEWLKAKRQTLGKSSYIKYSGIMEKYIKPRLGSEAASAVNTVMVDSFSSELLRNDGLSAKTVKDILLVLNAALNYTAKSYPGSLTVPNVTYPKVRRREMRVLTAEEQARLTIYLVRNMDDCGFGVLLALMTGLRIGELCALKWGAISLVDGTVRVSATMQRLRDPNPQAERKTTVYIGRPKSELSCRVIPMPARIIELCREMRKADPEAYVLTGSRAYLEPRVLQYRFKKYTTACGLSGVHFHTLRHTFATRCVEVGFEIKSLSEILGHSSAKITLDRYVHSSIELKRNNVNKLQVIGL